jgi:hypothetical protein
VRGTLGGKVKLRCANGERERKGTMPCLESLRHRTKVSPEYSELNDRRT